MAAISVIAISLAVSGAAGARTPLADSQAQGLAARVTAPDECLGSWKGRPFWRVVAGIVARRDATWDFEQRLDLPRSKTTWPERRSRSCAYLEWSARLWKKRALHAWHTWAATRKSEGAIRFVFGPYAEQALAVARCESGASMTPRAMNGQYLGMFQMGEYARSRFGHGKTPLEQARAAYAYFRASGSDWSPWSCRP